MSAAVARALAWLAVLLWLALPAVASGSTLNLVVFALITLLQAIGLSLLFGYGGQISLGQAGFYGIGAYVAAWLSTRTGLPVLLDVLLAVLVPAALGYGVGRPVLRLRGYTLAMVTAALGLILHTVFTEWSSVTGGYSGITGIPPLGIGTLTADSTSASYYVIGVVAFVVLWLAFRLVRTAYGLAMRTMRESEPAARSVGIDVPGLKAEVFGLSAGLSGLAGALYAHYVGYISPDSFTIDASVNLLLALVVGGIGSLWGAVLGAFLLTFLPQWLHSLQNAYGLVFGGLVIVLLIVEPGGLLGVFRRAIRAGAPAG